MNIEYDHFYQMTGTFYELLDSFYQLKGTWIMVTFCQLKGTFHQLLDSVYQLKVEREHGLWSLFSVERNIDYGNFYQLKGTLIMVTFISNILSVA